MQFRHLVQFLLFLIGTLQTVGHSFADDPSTTTVSLKEEIESLRKKSGAPGLVAGYFDETKLISWSSGVRKIGSDNAITASDQFHLGSCTKSMTSVLIGQLVDEGQVLWKSTLGELFPDEPLLQDSAWRNTTIEELLEHRSGAPANCEWSKIHLANKADGVVQSRRKVLQWLTLQERPSSPKYLYSNVGYALLGHICESKWNEEWESLMQSRIFKPLQMESGGFGPPLVDSQVLQPMGHAMLLGIRTPVLYDNAPPLGPAGTVHCSIDDWVKYLRIHLRDEQVSDSKLAISSPSLLRLHTPQLQDSNYAGGWVVRKPKWGSEEMLFHNGSNTFWYVSVYLDRSKREGYFAAVNSADASSKKGCEDAIELVFKSK